MKASTLLAITVPTDIALAVTNTDTTWVMWTLLGFATLTGAGALAAKSNETHATRPAGTN